MKTRRLTLILACLSALAAARAAAPAVQTLSASSAVVGELSTLAATVTDADGNLASVKFYVSGPGISGWQLVATIPVSGSQASPQTTWSPSTAGFFTARAEVADTTPNTATRDQPFEGFAGRLTIAPVTVANGEIKMFLGNGEIVTTENTAGSSVVAQNGAALIFWSGGRVALKPGFRAADGSFFWAAVDHDMNGYSDVEESLDSDGDGLPDAWEVDHGLNPFDPSDAAHIVVGTSQTYLQVYQSGHNVVPTSGSGTFQLVLRTPANSFLGVNTTTWVITGPLP